MIWAGTSITFYGLPERGHRLGCRWLDNDESLYWNYDEDAPGVTNYGAKE